MKKKLPIAAVIVLDFLLTAFILLTFAFFHHVLPMLMATAEVKTAAEVKTTVIPTPTAPPTPALPQSEAEETPEPESDLTEWQKRFAAYFTEETVCTENSYTSPTVSVEIEKIETGESERDRVTYFVADIHVASTEYLRTWVANGKFEYFSTQDVLEMDEASAAVVSVNGDFYSYQKTGFLVRNGELYKRDYTYCDLCVLFDDGTMECYARNTYDIDELLERGVWQAWNFGPSLLDEDGHGKPRYEVPTAVSYVNPRSAIGYYEPGHYCFVLVDGRQNGYSRGMTIDELAGIFEELGCRCAYNLDGGGSAVMTFAHERYSRQSNSGDRALGDIVLVTDTLPDESVSFLGQ